MLIIMIKEENFHRRRRYRYVTVPQGCTGTLDGLVGSHIRLASYPTLAIHYQRVVIYALLNTRFKRK